MNLSCLLIRKFRKSLGILAAAGDALLFGSKIRLYSAKSSRSPPIIEGLYKYNSTMYRGNLHTADLTHWTDTARPEWSMSNHMVNTVPSSPDTTVSTLHEPGASKG